MQHLRRVFWNTYRLEQAAYFQQVKRQLDRKSQGAFRFPEQTCHEGPAKQVTVSNTKWYPSHLSGFHQEIDQGMGNYRRLSQTLLKDSLLHRVAYNLQYTRVLLYHSAQTDTLLQPGSKSLLLAGTGSRIFALSEGKQQVGFQVKAKNSPGQTRFYRLMVWNQSSISATGWQQAVLRRSLAILSGAYGLFNL